MPAHVCGGYKHPKWVHLPSSPLHICVRCSQLTAKPLKIEEARKKEVEGKDLDVKAYQAATDRACANSFSLHFILSKKKVLYRASVFITGAWACLWRKMRQEDLRKPQNWSKRSCVFSNCSWFQYRRNLSQSPWRLNERTQVFLTSAERLGIPKISVRAPQLFRHYCVTPMRAVVMRQFEASCLGRLSESTHLQKQMPQLKPGIIESLPFRCLTKILADFHERETQSEHVFTSPGLCVES